MYVLLGNHGKILYVMLYISTTKYTKNDAVLQRLIK